MIYIDKFTAAGVRPKMESIDHRPQNSLDELIHDEHLENVVPMDCNGCIKWVYSCHQTF